MSSNSNDKISKLISEINQILYGMVALEYIEDNRSYSTIDILEALNLTSQIVTERIQDGFDDWKNDDIHNYYHFFNSVKEQTIITIENNFKLPCVNKYPRFVDTFNGLVLERLFKLFSSLEPVGTISMVGSLIDMFSTTVSEIEINDNIEIAIKDAQKLLAQYRRYTNQEKKVDTRLNLIQSLFEKVKES